MGETGVVNDLRRVLTLPAAQPDEQVAYLRGLGPVSVDELGLEFDDVAGAALASVRAGGRRPPAVSPRPGPAAALPRSSPAPRRR
jgi:hypothetical protein